MRVHVCKSVVHRLLHAGLTATPEEKSGSMRHLYLGKGYPALGQVGKQDKLLRSLQALVFNIYTNSLCAGFAGFKSIPLKSYKEKVDTSRANNFCRLFSSP